MGGCCGKATKGFSVVEYRILTIQRILHSHFLCEVQVQALTDEISMLANYIRGARNKNHDVERVFSIVTCVVGRQEFLPFLPFRTAVMRLLMALEPVSLQHPAYQLKCVDVLTTHIGTPHFSKGWSEYACVRAHFVKMLQRNWPTAAQPFLCNNCSAVHASSPGIK